MIVIAGGVVFFVLSQNMAGEDDGGTGGFSLRNFFPFGRGDAPTGAANNQTDTGEQNTDTQFAPISAEIPSLRKISTAPVAGMVIFNIGTTSIVRFVEKATGNVYEARSDSSIINRLTNTTIPKIIRVFWLPSGKGFLAQTVDEEDLIETAYVELKEVKTTSNELSVPYESVISKLPTGIKEISVSPDGKKIIYYTTKGVSEWFISNPDGTGPKIVYQSNLTEWIPQWFSANSVLITTKTSSAASSFGYILNTSNSQISKVFGDIKGGSALISPDGKKLIYSIGGQDSVSLVSTNVSGGAVASLGSSLPEKCAWDPSDYNYIICGVLQSLPPVDYPDDWYKGSLSTNDFIERINIVDNFTFLAADPENQVDQKIDVAKIAVSKDGRFASFIDKNDSSLWFLKIKD